MEDDGPGQTSDFFRLPCEVLATWIFIPLPHYHVVIGSRYLDDIAPSVGDKGHVLDLDSTWIGVTSRHLTTSFRLRNSSAQANCTTAIVTPFCIDTKGYQPLKHYVVRVLQCHQRFRTVTTLYTAKSDRLPQAKCIPAKLNDPGAYHGRTVLARLSITFDYVMINYRLVINFESCVLFASSQVSWVYCHILPVPSLV